MTSKENTKAGSGAPTATASTSKSQDYLVFFSESGKLPSMQQTDSMEPSSIRSICKKFLGSERFISKSFRLKSGDGKIDEYYVVHYSERSEEVSRGIPQGHTQAKNVLLEEFSSSVREGLVLPQNVPLQPAQPKPAKKKKKKNAVLFEYDDPSIDTKEVDMKRAEEVSKMIAKFSGKITVKGNALLFMVDEEGSEAGISEIMKQKFNSFLSVITITEGIKQLK